MMNIALWVVRASAWALAVVSSPVLAFNSGSTGADGAFSPTVNTILTLPPSGVFNFTTVNIPQGVTVTFRKNAANTPVTLLASGNVTIAGTVSVDGESGADVGAAGNGGLGDDGIPGNGGPGGFGGGRGGGICTGNVATAHAGDGLGPGGGKGARWNLAVCDPSGFGVPSASNTCEYFRHCWDQGGGGGHSVVGGNYRSNSGYGGAPYGSSLLLPLVGGSGGGGGSGTTTFLGAGGGGGGGAILIASSGTVSITGAISARGGNGGCAAGSPSPAAGGGGSGGGIRIVATTISGNGSVRANGGGGTNGCGTVASGGRVRFEAETFSRTAASDPAAVVSLPGPLFVAGFPTLRISTVAGIAVPEIPSGNADVRLAADAANPVVVQFATTGVPVGNTVRLTVTPAREPSYSVISPALTGSTNAASASVSVNIPTGPSVLQATTTYTIVASLGDQLAPFAEGERVERVTLLATLGGESTAVLTTHSGREFSVPMALLASIPFAND